MQKPTNNISSTLLSPFTSRATTYEQREKYLLDLLENVLPSCDVGGIGNELRKGFLLGKHKSKVVKKKPQKTPFITVRKGILLGLNKFGKQSLRYIDMLPLNSLWLDYMHHMLGIEDFTKLPKGPTDSRWENVNQRLIKADYHGAILSVVRSKCPSTVGIKGIIIQDTKNTFRLLNKDNRIQSRFPNVFYHLLKNVIVTETSFYVLAVPKLSSVFLIHLENDVNIEVYGKELCIRPAERSVKKFKNLHVPEL